MVIYWIYNGNNNNNIKLHPYQVQVIPQCLGGSYYYRSVLSYLNFIKIASLISAYAVKRGRDIIFIILRLLLITDSCVGNVVYVGYLLAEKRSKIGPDYLDCSTHITTTFRPDSTIRYGTLWLRYVAFLANYVLMVTCDLTSIKIARLLIV